MLSYFGFMSCAWKNYRIIKYPDQYPDQYPDPNTQKVRKNAIY